VEGLAVGDFANLLQGLIVDRNRNGGTVVFDGAVGLPNEIVDICTPGIWPPEPR